uniref:C2H2-type domain-containing protein n=1 Tax=Trichogramma kaykai TaxID=54128 RepID=A0ABD2WSV9_9HYME
MHVKSSRFLCTNFCSEDSFTHHHWHNHPSDPDLPYSDAIELESHAALTETLYYDSGESFWTTEPYLCGESQIEIDCIDQAPLTIVLSTGTECNVCHQVFPNWKALRKHEKLFHPELLVHGCGVCNRQFPVRHGLISHKKYCITGNNYKCNVCHEAFSLRSLLTDHQKVTHPELLAHKCDLCDKTFLKEENLIQHKKNFHKYECDVCHRGFEFQSH